MLRYLDLQPVPDAFELREQEWSIRQHAGTGRVNVHLLEREDLCFVSLASIKLCGRKPDHLQFSIVNLGESR